MKPDEASVAFRRMAHDAHLSLSTSVDEEERYVFDLRQGSLTLPQHPEIVRRLLDLAEEAYGFRQGEHAELLALAAPRAELEDVSGLSREIHWRHVTPAVLQAGPGLWVDLHTWIDDQFLMEQVAHLWQEGDAV